jgi:hypothetical protein
MQKNDGVIESVRYSPQGRISLVRVFLRRGATYSDWVLLTREQLIQQLKGRKHFVIGKRIPLLASTFETGAAVELRAGAAGETLATRASTSDHDDLKGAPLF